MLGIFSRPFLSLEKSDLIDAIIDRRVREHIHLDYKSKAYDHARQDTIEMLADVTAMANAQGGYIVIGVTEDETEPDGTPKELIGIENGDAEATWIQNVCLSSIEEKLTGLQVRDIPLNNGKSCVIIQVPNSLRKPHMIVYQRHRSFRLRHGRDKSFMGMQEVRNMILSINSYRESLSDFIESRKEWLRQYANGLPWLLLMATPIYIDMDKIEPLREDIRDFLEKAPGVPDSNYTGIQTRNPIPSLHGIEAKHRTEQGNMRYEQALRLFRNGHFEFCKSYRHDVPEGWPVEGEINIESYRITVELLHFLRVAGRITELGEISEPIAVTLQLENFNPSRLIRWRREPDWPDTIYWEEPSLEIELTASDLFDPEDVAKNLIDRLFNAFGYDDNRHFDAKNQFIIGS